MVEAADERPVKVILETGFLSREDLTWVVEIFKETGAHFVKTSTGFGFVKAADGSLASTGATRDDIRLMREHFSRGVKASGGIRSLSDARAFVEMGASRLGTSSTESLVQEEQGYENGAESNTSY